ncbi:MAG: BamA/TamA family outer membrane protein [Ignavibacteriaceae bacterium]|nr:BamA/TamA family outer membrane protein [Ignavibacteriaceae bacterium]
MIHLTKNILLVILIFSSIAFAQKIEKIDISSNRIFSDGEIKKWAGLNEGQNYFSGIIDTSLSRISTNLISNGYFNFTFKGSQFEISSDSQKVNLFLNVDEGQPTFVKEIFFKKSDSVNVDDFISSLNYLKGEIFNRYEIETSISSLLTDFENRGFPFAAVKIQSVHLYDDSVSGDHYADIYLALEEGRKSRIDKIEVSGNTSTKDYVITRELRIDNGEEYSQQKIENLPRRLNKLRYFDPVPVPQFYIDSQNNGVLLVNVKERNTNNFDGIIGYVPATKDNESGYVTGLVNVTLRNMFGTGRAAAIRWQKLTRESQELELKYLEPWLFGYPFNLNAELFQRIQDTTYVQRRLGGALEFLATEDISASAFISTEEIIPTERTIPVFTVYNSSSLTTGLGLKIDLRDDPIAPTGGFLFETLYSFSKKKINGPAEYITPALETSINLQRITVGFGAFYEIFVRNVIAFSVNGKELSGPFFEQSDLWRFGGTRTVRGYREEQFLASRIAWANLEYRLMLTQRSYAFIFFDSGYYFLEADPDRGITQNEDYIFGYGLGITVETAIGLLGVSFALAQGDSFSEGKIHFGIINEF